MGLNRCTSCLDNYLTSCRGSLATHTCVHCSVHGAGIQISNWYKHISSFAGTAENLALVLHAAGYMQQSVGNIADHSLHHKVTVMQSCKADLLRSLLEITFASSSATCSCLLRLQLGPGLQDCLRSQLLLSVPVYVKQKSVLRACKHASSSCC